MNLKLLFIFFIISIANILSQKISISGVIKDSETGVILSYANIQVNNTNYGTVSNNDGRFQLFLDSANYAITFSYIGYDSKIISVDTSEEFDIKLQPITYELKEVIVSSLTWAEKFILRAIEKNQEARKSLHFYTADVYSKTTFKHKKMGVFGLLESISQVNFLEPDLYQENLKVYKISPNMKTLPYQAVAVNQSINLMNPASKIWSFFLVNPLNEKSLEYYNFSLENKTLINTDTVVVIKVESKDKNIPLFEGKMFFLLKTHQLVEAQLTGNRYAQDAVFDSLELFQKFTLKDSIFVLPSFTKFSINFNYPGFIARYNQEYTFINYSINNPDNKPYITLDNILVEEPNTQIDLNLKRDETFKVPITTEEQAFNDKIQKMFTNAPFYKKFLLYTITNLFPIILDQSSDIMGYKFSKFSNLYRFNKAEGHYLGMEYTLVNNDFLNFNMQSGYAFNAGEIEGNLHVRWRNLTLDIWKNIPNLGNFNYVKSFHTIEALFSHKDNLHFYKSFGALVKYNLPLSSKISLTPFLNFDWQKPADVNTEFSIFERDRFYENNFRIPEYHNNNFGVGFNYSENADYSTPDERIFKGQSFTNISASIEFGNRDVLKSSENSTELNIQIDRYQEIYSPLKIELQTYLRILNNSDFINRMSFANNSETFGTKRNTLTFYSVNNYKFYAKDYAGLKCDITLFKLPPVLGLQMFAGTLYAYVYSINNIKTASLFRPLSKDFAEYGLSIKGISFLNVYFLKNTLSPDKFYVGIDFSI